VTGVTAGPYEDGEVGDVIVTWEPNPGSDGVDHYNVYWSDSPDVEATAGNFVASVAVGRAFYIHEGVAPGTYYYAVTAVDAAGNEGPISESDPGEPKA
jgi:fibronectin type 3 domain-containing protein